MHERIIAVNSNTYHGFGIEQAIAGIADAGFHAIELTATKGWTEHVFPTMSFHELCRIQDLLSDKNLSVVAMSGHCNLMDSRRVPDFVDNIKLAHFFGTQTIVSSVGEAHPKDRTNGTESSLLANISTFLPLLETYGMRLVLETHGSAGTGAAIDKLVKDIASPLVGIAYDTANVIYYGGVKDLSDLASCIDDVRYLHVKDKAGSPETWNFPALGKGYVDFPGVFALLDENNNDAPLSVEIEFTDAPRSLKTVDDAVRDSATYLKNLGYRL
ncbi:MAG: sugar phosphate isomerase/epimerase family protein [Sphaerochaetaceae bacterium]|jgi:sugar phosphate isomerase/epimerase